MKYIGNTCDAGIRLVVADVRIITLMVAWATALGSVSTDHFAHRFYGIDASRTMANDRALLHVSELAFKISSPFRVMTCRYLRNAVVMS